MGRSRTYFFLNTKNSCRAILEKVKAYDSVSCSRYPQQVQWPCVRDTTIKEVF